MARVIVTMAFALSFVAVTAAPRPALASAEPRKTNSGLPEHWATNEVVVVLDPSLEQQLGDGVADAIMAAMRTWTTDVPELPQLVFQRSSTHIEPTFDGKSVVSAGEIDIPGHEKDLAVTTSYAEDATGAIVEADILFNTRYVFATNTAGPCQHVYDLGAVATHETGHFFGLGEDYVDDTTTMYITTLPCDAHKRTLTASDESSISTLYATAAVTQTTMQCDAARGPQPASRAWVVVLGLGLMALVRRVLRISRGRRS